MQLAQLPLLGSHSGAAWGNSAYRIIMLISKTITLLVATSWMGETPQVVSNFGARSALLLSAFWVFGVILAQSALMCDRQFKISPVIVSNFIFSIYHCEILNESTSQGHILTSPSPMLCLIVVEVYERQPLSKTPCTLIGPVSKRNSNVKSRNVFLFGNYFGRITFASLKFAWVLDFARGERIMRMNSIISFYA